jgi:hypothetical protein
VAVAAFGVPIQSGADERLVTWRVEGDRVVSDGDALSDALPVGSLQKPFVAKAWASAHPGATPPTLRCDSRSACWRRSGHGIVDLTRATVVSCNAYFRELARETPPATLATMLREAGFLTPSRPSVDEAIGLDSDVTIPPASLLMAYRRLVREPWSLGEPVRRALLAGLREAALDGTAKGIEGQGYWAKTGTVTAVDGAPTSTSGWAVAVDDSGWGILGLLRRGTGRDAARALAGPMGRLRPLGSRHGGASRVVVPHDPARPETGAPVRVSLFDALHPARIEAQLVGDAPVLSSRGYQGPGAKVDLRPGDVLGLGLWDLVLPDLHLKRRIRGEVRAALRGGGGLSLVASLDRREYVDGVVLAELPSGAGALREALAAAVLRFVDRGPRHHGFDLCDTTHCAWFVGRGPRVSWVRPTEAVISGPAALQRRPLTDDEWARAVAAAGLEGPAYWTGHCGGAPLSPHALWGNGDRRVTPCPRHGGVRCRPWRRTWSRAEVDRAFGPDVEDIAVDWPDGVWTLVLATTSGRRELLYDEAHRAIAATSGWAAMPSPADRILRAAAGWTVEGVGLGHRVGICLGE